MKEVFKKNYKLIMGIIIGAIVSGIGTYAAVTIASSSVSYDNTTSGASATDVKGALDELYSLANNPRCPTGYTKSGNNYNYTCSKPIPTPVSFADDSWDTIIANVQAGNTSAYAVGSTKTVDMGTLGTHTLRVANNSTPAECSTEGFSQTACGFVLEFADIITEYQMNPFANDGDSNGDGNRGGWEFSEMRTYVNNDIYNVLPSALKSAIINTTVVSGHGYKDTTNFTTIDKLYLLSTKEVGFDFSYDTAKAETRILDYYSANNNDSTRIKQYNGSNDYWWLRSARSDNYRYFFMVNSSGSLYADNSRYSYGFAPAFRIG